jgi:predicted peptidase
MILFLSPPVKAQSHLNLYEARIFKAKDGTEMPYRIFKDAAKTVNGKLPLVVFLHGAGERGNDNEAQLTHGSKLFIEHVDDYPAIVIFPQCAKESYWSSAEIDRSSMPIKIKFDYKNTAETPYLRAVEELIKEIQKEFSIDKKRIYITGLSMGGMGTFEIVSRNPKCFAAAMPICGGGDAINYNQKAKKVPFWIFHGTDDAVVSVKQSIAMRDALKLKGFDITYTEYQGVNHNSWDNAFAEPDFLEWMFSHKK